MELLELTNRIRILFSSFITVIWYSFAYPPDSGLPVEEDPSAVNLLEGVSGIF